MRFLTNEKLWDTIVKTPLITWMLKTTLGTCPRCDKPHLDTALDSYVGGKHQECNSCHLYSKIIQFWISFFNTTLDIRRSRVSKILADPYSKRAIKSIISGFLDFGVTRPLSIHAPLLVVWNYTYLCNLSCKHCYSDAGSTPHKELSTEDALQVVDQITDFGVTSLAFSGGEPLMRKDFFKVAEHAVESGLYVSLATNGVLLTKKTVEKLRKIGLHYVEVSLDGATSRVHDVFRGEMGAFERALEGIRNCVREDVCTCIAITATKNNLEDIPKVLTLAEDLGVERFTLFNFVPTGRGRDIIELDPSPEEREELLCFLNRKLLEHTKVAILTTAPQLARVVLQQPYSKQQEAIVPLAHMGSGRVSKGIEALAAFIGGCGAGRFYCAITPEGDIQPCVFLPIKVGNLREKALKDIWLRSPVFNTLRNRDSLKGRCSRCRYRFVCGGCRARAFAYHQDMLMSDPGCIRRMVAGD